MKRKLFTPQLCVALLCLGSTTFGQQSKKLDDVTSSSVSKLFTDSLKTESLKDSIVFIPAYAIIDYKNVAGQPQVDSHALQWFDEKKAIGINYFKDIIQSFNYVSEIEEARIQIGIPYYYYNIQSDEYFRNDANGQAVALSEYIIKYDNNRIDTIYDINNNGPIKYHYSNDMLAKIDYLDANCNVINFTEYLYNKDNQLIQINNVFPDDDYVETEKFVYQNGQLIFRSFEESDFNFSNTFIIKQDSFYFLNNKLCKVVRYADLGNNQIEYLSTKTIKYKPNGQIQYMRSEYIGDYFAAMYYEYYNDLLVESYTYEGSSSDSIKTLGKVFGYDMGQMNKIETSRFQNGQFEKTGLEEVIYSKNNIPKIYKHSTNYDVSSGEWIPGPYDRNVEIFYKELLIQVNADNNSNIDDVLAANLTMYPNPANDFLHVQNTSITDIDVTISNMLGQNILSTKLHAASKTSINIENLISGIYIVNFGNTGYSQKLVVE